MILLNILRALVRARYRKPAGNGHILSNLKTAEAPRLHIFYRISDAGYNKIKPDYIDNETCLRNAVAVFPPNRYRWHLLGDNCSVPTRQMIETYLSKECVDYVSVGHGAGTFNLALDKALQLDGDDAVYFVENDYLHRPEADRILLEGFSLAEPEYFTLYDHPDKYIDGRNPFVSGGGEETKVYLTPSVHWKLTNSTTMTFAARVKTLRRDEAVWRKWTCTTHPHDSKLFWNLMKKGKRLAGSIPGYSTHGETALLSPLTDWRAIGLFGIHKQE